MPQPDATFSATTEEGIGIAIGMKLIRSISIISVIKTCSPPKNLSATAAAVKLEMAIGVTAFIEKCLS